MLIFTFLISHTYWATTRKGLHALVPDKQTSSLILSSSAAL